MKLDPACIFCKIVERTAEANVLYEDERIIVFMALRPVNPGEFLIVPRGVEHRPVAEEEAHVLLFEPASTLNTGNVRDERTVADLERI